MLLEDDLPQSREDWAPILLSAMGSPDISGRQLDGLGGGLSSLSKVCVVKKSAREDADVDFTFIQVRLTKSAQHSISLRLQIGIKDTSVDYASNCGNMTSAIGPFALEKGMPYRIDESSANTAITRIWNTNTKKVINAVRIVSSQFCVSLLINYIHSASRSMTTNSHSTVETSPLMAFPVLQREYS